MAPGLTSVDFICSIQMVASEFGVKNMKVWIRPALDEPLRLLLVVQRCAGYFLGPFSTN